MIKCYITLKFFGFIEFLLSFDQIFFNKITNTSDKSSLFTFSLNKISLNNSTLLRHFVYLKKINLNIFYLFFRFKLLESQNSYNKYYQYF